MDRFKNLPYPISSSFDIGTTCFGPRTEIPHIDKIHDVNYCNANYLPATGLIDLPWASEGGKFKVGEVICEAQWPDGSPLQAAPRAVARKQIERLDAMGYTFLSAFELEFFVVDAETKKAVFDGLEFQSDIVLSRNVQWLYDVEKQLQGVGIEIGQMHTEYSPGQFELAMVPKKGIKPFDDMYVMKQALRDILPKYGVQPTFMTRPFSGIGGSSGLHFNHSLWDKDGKSAFYDSTKPDNMSDPMRYWIGGIMKHIHPLLVLCSPTPNCFRRLHNPWAPDKADWDFDHRMVAIRAKTSSAKSSLVENRLPTPAGNPYLIAAATIAAGIDGLKNKIEPPPKGQNDSNAPLASFEECVKALKEDKVIVDALGAEFVDWWVSLKTEFEMKKFADKSTTEEVMQAEREEYFDFI